MRIISGKYKGKKLLTANSISHIRPTTDRVKETMFNIITSNYRELLFDKNVLDLFCGSGSLGIEALSRGARSCVFVDDSKVSIELSKKNVSALNISKEEAIFYTCNGSKFSGDTQFSIIFMDPPYDSSLLENAMSNIYDKNLLDKEGIIIVETNKVNISTNFTLLDERKLGSTFIKIYSH